MAFWNILKKKQGERHKVKESVTRLRQDAQTRSDAIKEMEQDYNPYRVKIQRLYYNVSENGFIKACVDRRKELTTLRKWEFKNQDGSINEAVADLFTNNIAGQQTNKRWFSDVISHSLDAGYFGYSLIYLGDIINNEFKGTCNIQRTHVSPDRRTATSYAYMISGLKWDDEQHKDWYLYIDTPNQYGTSPCGYGMFFELSIYEILLRNVLGFNGDYIEVNVAPFRQIKTHKTDEEERAELLTAAINMASNGVILTDHNDDIVLHSSNGGTVYQAYDLLEKRLESKVQQIILGHQDAISSIAGKLGNSNEGSPAEAALMDKQTIDGEFIVSIVNEHLIPKMRNLGFIIPEGVVATLKDDNEMNKIAETYATIGEQMKRAGMQISYEYFEEKTGIPVQEQMQQVLQPTKSITNRLRELYS